ncbi:MAG: histidine kinase [Gammaproteobacteria bacterium]|nr:histidine kinase [Gammaproteobacteria bacterium]
MATESGNHVAEPVEWYSALSSKDSKWQKIRRCTKNCRILIFLVLLVIGFSALAYTSVYNPPNSSDQAKNVFLVLCLFNIAIFAITFLLLWTDYIQPLLNLEAWVQKMRSGDLNSEITVPRHGQMSELAVDLNDFGTMFNNLSRNTEQQLLQYTQHTEQKNQSLAILYDVASTINSSLNLSDLLRRFLNSMATAIKATAGSVRLLNTDDQMELVASIGFNEKLKICEKKLPSESCACSLNQAYDGFIYQESLDSCYQHIDDDFFKQDLGLIVVPLQYQGQTLGIFNLFIDHSNFKANEDYKGLFTSVGKHLGMAIAKARLDDESHKLSIIQERNRLSFELHDSLAQTLTSIRFQIRILDEILQQQGEYDSWHHLERIENTVEEANTELRSLIAHFQAPISNQPIIDAVKDLVRRFRSESDIPIFFQHSIDNPLQFPDRIHLEVMRIVQEALNNIRKHSEASVARVMIRLVNGNQVQILIEDDGVGIKATSRDILPGEQIGLKSMRERAARIKAGFTLDSDPGDGTRVILEINQEEKAPEDIVSIETSLNQSK